MSDTIMGTRQDYVNQEITETEAAAELSAIAEEVADHVYDELEAAAIIMALTEKFGMKIMCNVPRPDGVELVEEEVFEALDKHIETSTGPTKDALDDLFDELFGAVHGLPDVVQWDGVSIATEHDTVAGAVGDLFDVVHHGPWLPVLYIWEGEDKFLINVGTERTLVDAWTKLKKAEAGRTVKELQDSDVLGNIANLSDDAVVDGGMLMRVDQDEAPTEANLLLCLTVDI